MAAAEELTIHDVGTQLLNAYGERAANPPKWKAATSLIGAIRNRGAQTHLPALRFVFFSSS